MKVAGAIFAGVGTALCLVLGLACSAALPTPQHPKKASEAAASLSAPVPAQSAEQRAHKFLEQMTLDEKMAYIGGDRDFFIRAIPRLHIPEIKMADGPVGCRNWGPSTAYPASIGIAASFSPTLAQAVGASIARDCRAKGVHILLAPGTNIQRSPLNGRNFEYFGEDPYLARDHSVGFIKGVQSEGVMATVKHFVANNQEWDRHHVSSEVSERALHEIYFPAFEGAVKDAHVGAVMSAYNLLNGAYASHNGYLLRQVLRDSWGFKGIVMSDWLAVHDGYGAVRGGTDLEMPRAQKMNPQALTQLLAAHKITEADIDEKVFHLLRSLIEFGFLDRPQQAEANNAKSATIALRAAQESVVLLKNQEQNGEHALPLNAKQLKKVAVIGPNASPAVHGGSGSAYTMPPHVVSLLQGLRRELPDSEVVYHRGIIEESGFGSLGQPVFAGPVQQHIFLGKELAGEAVHKSEVSQINMLADGASPAVGVPPENYSIRWTGKVRVDAQGSYRVLSNADDGVRVFVDGEKVIDDFTDHAPRMQQVDLELSRGEHSVVVEYFQGILGSVCQFGFGKKVDAGKRTGVEELRQVIAGADAIVVAVGYGQNEASNSLGSAYKPFWPPSWARAAGIVEAEDDDRTFALPAAQVATILEASEASKRVIVIGFAGGGVDFMPWLDHVQGLLWAWYPGQEGGTALAQTLLGRNNPSARLPVTFARNYEDHPAAKFYGLRLDLPEQKERGPRALLDACRELPQGERSASVRAVSEQRGDMDAGPWFMSPYCEDIFVGYRGFDHAATTPLFPFGFGLSYTQFSYQSLRLEGALKGELTAHVRLKNTGARAGAEVVQIYAAPQALRSSTVARAPQQLAGYARVELAPGQEKEIAIRLNPRAFAYYHNEHNETPAGWLIPAGDYEIRASTSSRGHLLRQSLELAEPLQL